VLDDCSGRLIATIYRTVSRAEISKSRRTWRLATARSDSFAFSRKGCASRAFQSLRTPRRNMLERRREKKRKRERERNGQHRRGKRREERYGCTYADGGLRASGRGIQSTSRARTTYCHVRWPAGHFNISAECSAKNGSAFRLRARRATKKEAESSLRDRHQSYPESWAFFLRVSCGRDDAGARPGTAGVKSISETVFEYIRDCSPSSFTGVSIILKRSLGSFKP